MSMTSAKKQIVVVTSGLGLAAVVAPVHVKCVTLRPWSWGGAGASIKGWGDSIAKGATDAANATYAATASVGNKITTGVTTSYAWHNCDLIWYPDESVPADVDAAGKKYAVKEGESVVTHHGKADYEFTNYMYLDVLKAKGGKLEERCNASISNLASRAWGSSKMPVGPGTVKDYLEGDHAKMFGYCAAKLTEAAACWALVGTVAAGAAVAGSVADDFNEMADDLNTGGRGQRTDHMMDNWDKVVGTNSEGNTCGRGRTVCLAEHPTVQNKVSNKGTSWKWDKQ